MNKLFNLLLILVLSASFINAQHSNRLFYGGYSGNRRINLMDEYDRSNARAKLSGNNLFSKPNDGKLFYHPLQEGYYYKGVVICDKNWDRVIVGFARFNNRGSYVLKSARLYEVGSSGYATGKFKNPNAVAVTYYDADEICIYVSDQLNDRVQRLLFNLNSGSVRGWSSLAAGKLNYPEDVEVDNKNDLSPGNDELWVADSRNHRIVRMNYSGLVLDSYGTIKTGTKGTSGNIINPNSLTIYRNLDKVYNHTIALSHTIKSGTEGMTNKELVVLNYNGSSFTKKENVSFPDPSLVTCVQFDQTSSTIYAVDKYNSKIYKYAYKPGAGTVLELAGTYGGYGTGAHQLKRPTAIHPIVPMKIRPGFYRGANYIGILEEWSDNSGIKIGYEGVDILNLNLSVSQTSEGEKMFYNYKMPSGVGIIKDQITQGGRYISNMDRSGPAYKIGAAWRGIWDGEDDLDRPVQNGNYTLNAWIESYWSRGDSKKITRDFYINTGVEKLIVPYYNAFNSTLDLNWHHGYGVRMSSASPRSPSYCLSLGNYDFNPGIRQTWHQWAGFKIDLSSAAGVKELSFWWKDKLESNTSCDVYITEDGGSKNYNIYNFPGKSATDNVWRKTTINLDQMRKNYGLGEQVELKFTRNIFFNPDHSIANRELAIDDVSVTVKTGGETSSTLKSSKGKNFSQEDNGTGQKLIDNYPNPFSTVTTIHYYLEEDSKVSLDIFNISGQKVASLVNSCQPKGDMNIVWDGKGNNGEDLPPGTYFCKLYINNPKNEIIISRPVLKVN